MDRLIIPSCSGVLDCFNNRLTRYYKKESMCCIQSDCNYLFAMALFSFFYINIGKENLDPFCTYTFKIADFKKYIGYSGGGKSMDVKAELLKLCEVGYIWDYVPEDTLIDLSFNSTSTFATVSSKYFGNLISHMRSKNSVRDRWGNIQSKGKSSHSSMVFTSILKERNVAAVEIVIELVKLIERRGQLEEGQTAHISIPTLIQRCPHLSGQLSGKAVKEQNRIIKGAIHKALDLMRVHTDIYNCFEDLKFLIPDKIGVKSEELINVRYKGRNVI